MECLQIGKTIEKNGMRMHRYQWSVSVTSLENAGKRGKTCKSISAYDYGSGNDSERNLNALCDDLMQCQNFDAASNAVKMHTSNVSCFNYQETESKGVEVAPEAFSPVEIFNDGVYVKVDWDSFSIRDKVDMNNEPTLISLKSSQAKKLYKLLKGSENNYKSYSFSDFWNFLQNNNVGHHYYCAMD
jgi:hypothetical protein